MDGGEARDPVGKSEEELCRNIEAAVMASKEKKEKQVTPQAAEQTQGLQGCPGQSEAAWSPGWASSSNSLPRAVSVGTGRFKT